MAPLASCSDKDGCCLRVFVSTHETEVENDRGNKKIANTLPSVRSILGAAMHATCTPRSKHQCGRSCSATSAAEKCCSLHRQITRSPTSTTTSSGESTKTRSDRRVPDRAQRVLLDGVCVLTKQSIARASGLSISECEQGMTWCGRRCRFLGLSPCDCWFRKVNELRLNILRQAWLARTHRVLVAGAKFLLPLLHFMYLFVEHQNLDSVTETRSPTSADDLHL